MGEREERCEIDGRERGEREEKGDRLERECVRKERSKGRRAGGGDMGRDREKREGVYMA